ncbi:ABC transporter ATP-binding protein [Dactylosporangium aurantiacum]|uniref:ABC transporter ATP-binding protein n=1 Tax=Dactylosporangium aurantiacum TaxID=35754 RepID=A0A9Q9MIX4_9ACTN|nr:ABC transporter ATP-binding protein [Dactylosporangium aurantiacum]MDG6105351.1 ABC transporter ATP-binding protein [Dactylosporangium aurantiacum]UWZ54101.1 ABC transporter ATP-binding protein [Dactylosporangium aurantiacum]
MKRLPLPEPGEPDSRSAARYLLWILRNQLPTILAGIVLGIVWMVSQALVPAAVGAGVDALTSHDRTALLGAGGALLGLGTVTAVSGIMRHRFAVTNFLDAGFRTMQVTARHATRLGATLPKKVATGEVVSIGTTDFDHIGYSMDVSARASGAVVAIVVVAVLLLDVSVPLGLVVVIGVPLLVTVVGLLLKPLHQRRRAQRELAGALTGRAADIVSGLRILRGVGGEDVMSARYRAESQQVRAAGVRVAKVESLLEGAQILLPGLFVALVTWLGARFAVAGRITPGELVAFYAYAAFLVGPLRTLTEFAEKLTRGLVAAGRVVSLLRVEPEFHDPAAPAPVIGGDLDDPGSGFAAAEGRLTAIAATRPEDAAAIADRIGLLDPASEARLVGVPLRRHTTDEVRAHIVVADNDDRLFRGRLQDELGTRPAAVLAALDAAAARDIVDALPAGLDTEIAERGRDFSGGQQQRLRLARVLALDPPVLVLVEPTSAVDTHTEALIARNLPAARAGRTTVVCTTSPLLLDRADTVAFVDATGRVAATGTHRELLATCPAYAATVTREEDS